MPKDPLKTRLEIAKNKVSKRNLFDKKNNPSPIGTAFKLSTELVAAVAVGTIIGFIFDKTFGTKPWFILIFFFVGVVAGITNVIRSAKNMQK
ncbi:AtpZ/AtpI family protein [Candidatus Pelagibacter sp.]|jgi:ATP synthase protein I|nr:AtpZ/AtpI family protein [Pelagibacterales bacterium SAG-MED22]MDC3074283.1 AtpZ/AtpI family protein [Candidatus Pelagibacter sp.]MDC3184581.1 AtpZ/AtpI family protein [Candidatus Pelagibacter sp.]